MDSALSEFYNEVVTTESSNAENTEVEETKSESNENFKDLQKSPENYRYENNVCIYTNPETKDEYTWSEVMKQWVPRGSEPYFDGTSYKYKDKQGETYKWDGEKNIWAKCTETEENCYKYAFDGEHHTYTDPKDNTVYFWDREKNAWFPKIDDDFMARYQMSYGFVDNVEKKELKEEDKEIKKRKPSEPGWFDLDDAHNTKVYVSNLPLDLTEQEFVDFMQKCGLVLKDMKSNKWKVKLYTENDGKTFKGDALCNYIKVESVELALNVLDGADLRGHKVNIQRAKFQQKGEYNPALKPKKKRKKEKEKEKKIQEKLLAWKPEKLRGEREKHERVVILKNVFDPKDFEEHVELLLEYNEDIRSECQKCGVVRKVQIFDRHPEGVAQITFSQPEEADLCIQLLNNRWFGKRQIKAEIWDGKTKYKIVESHEETEQRLSKWNRFLETADNDKEKPSD